ncbi:MAG: GntR family transcriptional regulator [Alsobacter sp.]
MKADDVHPGDSVSTSQPRSRRRQPLHSVIFDALRRDIRSGRWDVGALLPSEQEIGALFDASRITVRHALQRLEAEGLVRKQHGRRTEVVAQDPSRQSIWQINTLDDLIASAGTTTLKVMGYRRRASRPAAEALGVDPAARLWCLESVLERQASAYARSLIYFPPGVGDRLVRRDFDDVIVFRVLASRLGLVVADVTMTVQAGEAEAADARLLGCQPGSPMLLTQLVYRTAPGAAPVEVAFTRFPAGTYSLSYSLTARPPAPPAA